MLIGEAPGEQDVLKGIPFAGSAGDELSRMLGDAGLSRNQCFLTTVIRVRPIGNDIGRFIAMRKADITPEHKEIRGKMCLPPVWEGIALLSREIELCQPDIIVAFGNVALWALTGKWGITSWRGSMLNCDLDLALPYKPKVIPTYHPAAILRMWSWRQTAVQDLRRAKATIGTGEWKRPHYSFIIEPSFEQALGVLQQLYSQLQQRPGKIAIDIETRAKQIACVGIAWSKTEALCIPLMVAGEKKHYWSPEDEVAIGWWLMRVLTHPNCEGVGQNFLYDAQYFYRWFCEVPSLARDTMLTQHSMFSNMQKGLDYLSSMYCDFHEYWKDEGKDWDEKTGEQQLWTYNCKDAVVTFEVDDAQQSVIESFSRGWPQLQDVNNFQQSLFSPVLKTMNRGIRVNKEKRAEFAISLLDEIAKRQQWMLDLFDGEELNPKSPKQMCDFFYGQLKLKPVINRKTGNPTCDDEALQKIKAREPALASLINCITELRSLGVFLSTFVNAPLDIDSRIRCSFNIGGTETYRFSSSQNAFDTGLNLQNIPPGGGDLDLPNIRTLFIPDPGKTFFDIDLASADLRIVVWESDEQEMKALLKAGLDPYTEIAKEFYHDPSITKKDPRRQTFKSFAHGTNYLGTAKGLAERLGLSVHEAEKTQRWYFGRFPRIKKWQDDLKDQVVKRRMVQNVFGYRCYFMERIEGTIFNQAAAWIPQSTVACLINRAYVAIDQQLPEVEILLQVHDSLAGQFDTYRADVLLPQIIKCAEIALPYDDPLTIPVGVKSSPISWGHCA